MGQFSAEKPVPPGSTLSGNQQLSSKRLKAANAPSAGQIAPRWFNASKASGTR